MYIKEVQLHAEIEMVLSKLEFIYQHLICAFLRVRYILYLKCFPTVHLYEYK